MIKIKLKKFLHAPIEEGRVDDMKKKYPGKDDLIDQLAAAPGNNKYLDWMMKHIEEADDAGEMLKVISDFHKKLPQIDKKDINQYDSFDNLAWTVKKTKEPTKELERRGTLKLYEDDKLIMYRPLNTEASCKLGASTKWCISSTKSHNYFNQYAEEGAQHFFIKSKILPKEDPNSMIAYTFNDNDDLEIFNAEDDNIEREDVAEIYGKDIEDKINTLAYGHFKEADMPSEIEQPTANHEIDIIKSMSSGDSVDESRIKRAILKLFGMERMSPGQKDIGDMMINSDYNERNVRALLDLNNNIVNKLLYRVVKEYYQIQEYLPKRLVKKILDLRQPNQDFKLSESKIFIKIMR